MGLATSMPSFLGYSNSKPPVTLHHSGLLKGPISPGTRLTQVMSTIPQPGVWLPWLSSTMLSLSAGTRGSPMPGYSMKRCPWQRTGASLKAAVAAACLPGAWTATKASGCPQRRWGSGATAHWCCTIEYFCSNTQWSANSTVRGERPP